MVVGSTLSTTLLILRWLQHLDKVLTGSKESLAESGCNAGGGEEEFVVVDVALGETVGGRGGF